MSRSGTDFIISYRKAGISKAGTVKVVLIFFKKIYKTKTRGKHSHYPTCNSQEIKYSLKDTEIYV